MCRLDSAARQPVNRRRPSNSQPNGGVDAEVAVCPARSNVCGRSPSWRAPSHNPSDSRRAGYETHASQSSVGPQAGAVDARPIARLRILLWAFFGLADQTRHAATYSAEMCSSGDARRAGFRQSPELEQSGKIRPLRRSPRWPGKRLFQSTN